MKEIRFEWDENKNTINKSKHKIAFEEAKTVFEDADALVIDDPDHSRESDSVIRIISARKATKTETRQYNEF